jgi:phosphoribosylpyrophosphate synthetase
MLAAVHRLSLEKAIASYEAGQVALAAEWLALVPDEMRPADLAGAVHYALARAAASEQRWSQATGEMERAVRVAPANGLYQQRLALLRRRQPLLADHAWAAMAAQIDPAARLEPEALVSEVASVCACGAYYSRGSGRAAPWSRYLRKSKSSEPDPAERAAVLGLASDYFCRFVAQRTHLLAVAEVVVPIPADSDRYLARMGSLPDELAKAVQAQLAVPAALFALQRTTGAVEMKQLPSAERRAAAENAYRPGPERNMVDGHAVLLVDDVITTGSTLRSAARVLRDAGATTVVAAALSHTEG